MFHKLVNSLNQSNARWWLNSGSLLGAVRDGHMPEGDTDIDIGMYYEDAWMIQTLGVPYQVNKKFNGVTSYWTVHDNGFPINICCYFRIGDYRYYCQDDWMQDRLPAMMEFETRSFNGIDCKIPTIWERLLNEWFTNWKTPSKEIGRTEIYKIKFDHYENPHA